MLDDVLLLAPGGRVVFHGPSADVVRLGFRKFSICQIWLETSRNVTEISVHLNSKCKIHYLMVAQFE